MYQTVQTKSPFGRKLLLLAVSLTLVGTIILGTQQFTASNEKIEQSVPESPRDVVSTDDVSTDDVSTDDGEISMEDKKERKQVATAESDTKEVLPSSEEELMSETVEVSEDKVADVINLEERVVARTEEVNPVLDSDGVSDDSTRSSKGPGLAINRVTMVEQPDLSDIFQVTEHVKQLNVNATTGSKVAIDGEIFYLGDFIESSQTIKFSGQDESGALIFEAHGKRLKLRL